MTLARMTVFLALVALAGAEAQGGWWHRHHAYRSYYGSTGGGTGESFAVGGAERYVLVPAGSGESQRNGGRAAEAGRVAGGSDGAGATPPPAAGSPTPAVTPDLFAGKIAGIEGKLHTIESDLNALSRRVDDHERRLSALERPGASVVSPAVTTDAPVLSQLVAGALDAKLLPAATAQNAAALINIAKLAILAQRQRNVSNTDARLLRDLRGKLLDRLGELRQAMAAKPMTAEAFHSDNEEQLTELQAVIGELKK